MIHTHETHKLWCITMKTAITWSSLVLNRLFHSMLTGYRQTILASVNVEPSSFDNVGSLLSTLSPVAMLEHYLGPWKDSGDARLCRTKPLQDLIRPWWTALKCLLGMLPGIRWRPEAGHLPSSGDESWWNVRSAPIFWSVIRFSIM